MEDDAWATAVKGIKKLKTNRHVDEIKPKITKIRKDKMISVAFDVLKTNKCVQKDDFSQMDGHMAKRFKREEFKIEATLDLHGLTEKVAFDTVCDFIKTAYNSKKRCVLIITGKGLKTEDIFNEHGVLRKAVPGWLSNSEISSLILAYKNPTEALGGSGALYILLRKSI